MASEISPNHKPALGSMYCADPNCEYCKVLRATVEQVQDKKYIPTPTEKQSA
jgi:hypothetical protein